MQWRFGALDETMGLSRREFLGGCAAGLTLAGANAALAIEPIQRTGPASFQSSLAAYSLRKYLKDSRRDSGAGSLTLPGFIQYCAEQGLDGAELTAYYFPADVTDAYLDELKGTASKCGVQISGGAIGNDFCKPPGEGLNDQIAYARKWLEIYGKLGAPTIRFFAGRVPKGESEEKAVRRCTRVLNMICEEAGKHGVKVALENHGGVTARAEQLLKIVEAVDSPHFGVNFDSGNFRSSDDPYAELEMIAPYAISAQIKVEMTVGGKKAPADMERIVKILKDAQYSGWVALEYEAAEEPYEAIPKHLAEMKGLLRKYSS